MALCLAIEDDLSHRELLKKVLELEGYRVVGASTACQGLALVQQLRPDVVLLDLGLPDGDGETLIGPIQEIDPQASIIVLTGYDSARRAVAAFESGARGYLVKPVDHEELLTVIKRELMASGFREAEARRNVDRFFWGSGLEMKRLRETVQRLARSPRTPVLVLGETGSGKEVVAQELHELGHCQGPFIALNCAAVPEGLLESELFGHEPGAFTGAGKRRRGLAELANMGTLFLDEISEMEPRLQAKLLRFLQDGKFRPVGAERESQSTCRVVAATNLQLDTLRKGERLREDLFFRLAVVMLTVPPLRERREDLASLANFLLRRLTLATGRKDLRLSPRALEAILSHSWPGNVRELQNRLERAVVLSRENIITPQDLDLETPAGHPPIHPLDDPARLIRLLNEEDGNISAVARRLGVPRHLVRYRAHKLRSLLDPE